VGLDKFGIDGADLTGSPLAGGNKTQAA